MAQSGLSIDDLLKLYQPTVPIRKKHHKVKTGYRRYLKKAYPLQYGSDGKTLINHGPWTKEEKDAYLLICQQYQEICIRNIKKEMKEVYKAMLQKIPTRNLTQIKGFHIKKNPFPSGETVKEKKRSRRTKEEMKKLSRKKFQERELRRVEKLAKTNNEILTSQTSIVQFQFVNGAKQKIKVFSNKEIQLAEVYQQIQNQNIEEVKTEKVEITECDQKISEFLQSQNNFKLLRVQEKIKVEKIEEDDLGTLDQSLIVSVRELITHIDQYYEQMIKSRQRYLSSEILNDNAQSIRQSISSQNINLNKKNKKQQHQLRIKPDKPKLFQTEEIVISDDDDQNKMQVENQKNPGNQLNQKLNPIKPSDTNKLQEAIQKLDINDESLKQQDSKPIQVSEIKSEDEIYASQQINNLKSIQSSNNLQKESKIDVMNNNQLESEEIIQAEAQGNDEKQFEEISKQFFGNFHFPQKDINKEIESAYQLLKNLDQERKEKEAQLLLEKQKQQQELKKVNNLDIASQDSNMQFYQKIQANQREQKKIQDQKQLVKQSLSISEQQKQTKNIEIQDKNVVVQVQQEKQQEKLQEKQQDKQQEKQQEKQLEKQQEKQQEKEKEKEKQLEKEKQQQQEKEKEKQQEKEKEKQQQQQLEKQKQQQQPSTLPQSQAQPQKQQSFQQFNQQKSNFKEVNPSASQIQVQAADNKNNQIEPNQNENQPKKKVVQKVQKQQKKQEQVVQSTIIQQQNQTTPNQKVDEKKDLSNFDMINNVKPVNQQPPEQQKDQIISKPNIQPQFEAKPNITSQKQTIQNPNLKLPKPKKELKNLQSQINKHVQINQESEEARITRSKMKNIQQPQNNQNENLKKLQTENLQQQNIDFQQQQLQQQQQQQQQLQQQQQYQNDYQQQMYQNYRLQQQQQYYSQQQDVQNMIPQDFVAAQNRMYPYQQQMIDPKWQQYMMQNYYLHAQNQQPQFEQDKQIMNQVEYKNLDDQMQFKKQDYFYDNQNLMQPQDNQQFMQNQNEFQQQQIQNPSQYPPQNIGNQIIYPQFIPIPPPMTPALAPPLAPPMATPIPPPIPNNQHFPYQIVPQQFQQNQANDPNSQYQVEMMYVYHEVPQNFDPNLFFQFSPQSFVPIPGGSKLGDVLK